MEQPQLSAGDDFGLRAWRVADAPAVVAAFADPAIEQWHLRTVESVDEAHDWIEGWSDQWQSETNACWAIVDAEDAVCGQVSLRGLNLAMGVSQVSYWITPERRGHGLATRAVTALNDWAFADLGLHRLWLMHSTRNEPSCGVALAAGFVPEGTLREALFHPDGWHDMHVHGQLAPDSGQPEPSP
ncbi:MAG: GNAT family N-acetyltransferase [Nitriliruptoraceae bacterium]